MKDARGSSTETEIKQFLCSLLSLTVYFPVVRRSRNSIAVKKARLRSYEITHHRNATEPLGKKPFFSLQDNL